MKEEKMQHKGKLYAGNGENFIELDKTAEDFDKMEEALKIHNRHNNIGNDLKAYLWEVAKWGLGQKQKKPKPEDYGL